MNGANWYKLFLAQTSTSNISVFNFRARLSFASAVSVSSASALIFVLLFWHVLSDCVTALLVVCSPLSLVFSAPPSGSNNFFISWGLFPSLSRAGRFSRLYIYFAQLNFRLVGVIPRESAVYMDIYHNNGLAELFPFSFPPALECMIDYYISTSDVLVFHLLAHVLIVTAYLHTTIRQLQATQFFVSTHLIFVVTHLILSNIMNYALISFFIYFPYSPCSLTQAPLFFMNVLCGIFHCLSVFSSFFF